jgi:dTDP-4-dehydrorhamnose 3,5-epimerase-like enzyme
MFILEGSEHDFSDFGSTIFWNYQELSIYWPSSIGLVLSTKDMAGIVFAYAEIFV